MIDAHNFRALVLHLGFSADPQEVSDVLHKAYGDNGEVEYHDFRTILESTMCRAVKPTLPLLPRKSRQFCKCIYE